MEAEEFGRTAGFKRQPCRKLCDEQSRAPAIFVRLDAKQVIMAHTHKHRHTSIIHKYTPRKALRHCCICVCALNPTCTNPNPKHTTLLAATLGSLDSQASVATMQTQPSEADTKARCTNVYAQIHAEIMDMDVSACICVHVRIYVRMLLCCAPRRPRAIVLPPFGQPLGGSA